MRVPGHPRPFHRASPPAGTTVREWRGLLGNVVHAARYLRPSHRASPLEGTTGRKWRGWGGGFREGVRQGEHGSVRGAPRPHSAEPAPGCARAPRLPAGHPRVPQGRSPAGGSEGTARPRVRHGRGGGGGAAVWEHRFCTEIFAALRWDPNREVVIQVQKALLPWKGLHAGSGWAHDSRTAR